MRAVLQKRVHKSLTQADLLWLRHQAENDAVFISEPKLAETFVVNGGNYTIKAILLHQRKWLRLMLLLIEGPKK